MKRYFEQFALCLCLLLACSIDSNASQRRHERLDDGWSLYPRHDIKKQPDRIQVKTPHTWNSEDVFLGMGAYLRSCFVYERNIHIDQVDGLRRFLHFEGVNSVADVFINGRRVGSHYGGYTAFCFEITDYLVIGDNKLEVNVNNAYRQDVAPLAGDFNIYGGITRPVSLITTGTECISPLDHASTGVYVHQNLISNERAELSVETVLSTKRHGLNLSVSLIDSEGNTVAQAETPVRSDKERVPLILEDPHLWDGIHDPYLYTVRVDLKDGDKVIDSVSESTGLRWFHVDAEKGFFLNGKHYDLYGVCRHEEAEGTAGLLNEEAIRRMPA